MSGDKNPGESIAQQPPLEQVVAALVDVGSEYMKHEDGDYVDVPVGDGEAFQIEPDTTDTTVLGGFQVYFRAWDRTGGLRDERLLATVASHLLVPPVVREAVDEYDRQQGAMTPDPEKPGSEERIQQLWGMLVNADACEVSDVEAVRLTATDLKGDGSTVITRRGIAAVYKRAMVEAWCTVTGEAPEAVAERLEEAAQARHEEAVDDMERFEMGDGMP